VVAATVEAARKRTFSDAFERTLLFEVAVSLACLLLTFLLPGTPNGPGDPPGPSGSLRAQRLGASIEASSRAS
jgi:hypothetical protein